jgi:hypothetical protein
MWQLLPVVAQSSSRIPIDYVTTQSKEFFEQVRLVLRECSDLA